MNIKLSGFINFPEGYDPRDDGMLLLNREILKGNKQLERSIIALQGIHHPKKNVFVTMQEYRENADKAITALMNTKELIAYLCELIERMMADEDANKYKRWTKEADEALIEMICQGDNIYTIATALGRSPSSIHTRTSKLVGINRISKEIAGEFMGTLNGADIKGRIEGTLKTK